MLYFTLVFDKPKGGRVCFIETGAENNIYVIIKKGRIDETCQTFQ